MERQLPEIEIEGTVFQFDIEKLVLIEKSNPNNEISFNYMRNEDTHYSFEYSSTSKNHSFVKTDNEVFNLYDRINSSEPSITVTIPRIGVIDPEGMCRKYACTKKDIEHKSDFEIIVNQDVYKRRLNGKPVTIELAGNIYEVDVKNNALRPKDETGEVIYLNQYHYDLYYEDEEVYHLFFNISENRVADVMSDGSRDRTEDRVILEVPNLYYLDPIGANMHFGIDPKSNLMIYELKTHHTAKQVPWGFYNIEMDKEKNIIAESVYELRVKRGMLPTIDIEGHTFYVDLKMNKLRPKDDFLSNGIPFSDIEDYFNDATETYIIPYNPQKKELGEIDYETVTEIPDDLIVIEIPSEYKMDPIGWNRQHGYEILDGVKKDSLEIRFIARQAQWEEIYVPQKIRENLDQAAKKAKENKQDKPDKNEQNVQRKKGRKM